MAQMMKTDDTDEEESEYMYRTRMKEDVEKRKDSKRFFSFSFLLIFYFPPILIRLHSSLIRAPLVPIYVLIPLSFLSVLSVLSVSSVVLFFRDRPFFRVDFYGGPDYSLIHGKP
jgi:hypothetical protein